MVALARWFSFAESERSVVDLPVDRPAPGRRWERNELSGWFHGCFPSRTLVIHRSIPSRLWLTASVSSTPLK
jgi:hypothetical protein